MANEVTRRGDWLTDPFFDHFGHHFFGRPDEVPTLKTDIEESDTAYKLTIDVPGTKKSNVKLNYKDDLLSVSVRRDNFADHTDSKGNLLMSERSSGTMSRSYRIDGVDQDKIAASLENGVLTVTLPKLAEGQVAAGDIEIK